ncbi:MAG: diphosphomevalonate decarboxylase [Anaerolineales bacterium]|jgi:diphosphomevalonate decarboxylase|nr:diphosphomevalonate decarboxylase [Anaerolineales bacterium]
MTTASAHSCPNIAFIKYWGDQDPCLRIPANGSISMNLAGLKTQTTVTFDTAFVTDTLQVNGLPVTGSGLDRVSDLLARVRDMAGISSFAAVASKNNFPMGAGIASSASAFAALSLAASTAAGLTLSEMELSRLARSGSGSACRSIPGGFVEWQAGSCDEDSYAFTIASPEHWELVDCIVVISSAHKTVGSTAGHALALTSPIQPARVADAPRRLQVCRKAILERDFQVFAEVIELDSNLMHAIMITSTPPLLYWQPATLAVMRLVQDWRQAGLPVAYTIDAGPNVHVLTLAGWATEVAARLSQVKGVQQVLQASPGGAAYLLEPGC